MKSIVQIFYFDIHEVTHLIAEVSTEIWIVNDIAISGDCNRVVPMFLIDENNFN
jgi:hypothetical protein